MTFIHYNPFSVTVPDPRNPGSELTVAGTCGVQPGCRSHDYYQPDEQECVVDMEIESVTDEAGVAVPPRVWKPLRDDIEDEILAAPHPHDANPVLGDDK